MSAVTKNVYLETHVTVEKYLTYPLQEVVKNLVHHIDPLAKADFGFHNRLLLVAQSVISFAVLPFEMLVAIFSGINAMFYPTDERSWINLTCAFTSVALHAVFVPAGFILALVPEIGLAEIAKIRKEFAKNGIDTFETAFKPVTDWAGEYAKHVKDTMPKAKEPKPAPADVGQEDVPAVHEDREDRSEPSSSRDRQQAPSFSYSKGEIPPLGKSASLPEDALPF